MPASGDPWDGPEREVIGGGLIDDRFARAAGPGTPDDRAGVGFDVPDGGTPDGGRGPSVGAVVRETWLDLRRSMKSVRFWLAVGAGVVVPWAAGFLLAAWGGGNGWFEAGKSTASYFLVAALLAVSASALGTAWGFRSRFRGLPALPGLLARGVVLAVPAAVLLLVLGTMGGGSPAVALAAVVVVVIETLLFGMIGTGARGCFRNPLPGAVLAVLLWVALCVGNLVAVLALLPGTWSPDQASVPVNVERDKDTGRYTYYECVGELRPVEAWHFERIAWLAGSNPAVLFGSVAADVLPEGHDLGWVLDGLQWAADGPAWDVACLNGTPSEELPPPMPLPLSGVAVQLAVAVLALVPARIALRRRAE